MQQRIGRRVAIALAVPAVAVAGMLLAAGIATGSTTPGGASSGPSGTSGSSSTKSGSPSGSSSSKSGSPSGSSTSSGSRSGPIGPTASSGTSGGVVVPGGAGADCSNRTQPVTVKIGTAGGKSNVVVDQSGCALYLNNQDTATTTVVDAATIATWPPAHAPGTAGDGVQASNLGTFARPDGTSQVTFFGHQLYYNTGDTAPGTANGQGQNQTWSLVNAQGQPAQ